MRHIELKDLSSSLFDINKWSPASAADVAIALDLEIGPIGEDSFNMFYVRVATPEGLRGQAKVPIVADRATIVVREYSLSLVKRHIRKIIARCDSIDWSEACAKLQRYFNWEYEDYVEDTTPSRGGRRRAETKTRKVARSRHSRKK